MVNGKLCIALLTEINKAFDCTVHDFLIVKIEHTVYLIKLKVISQK